MPSYLYPPVAIVIIRALLGIVPVVLSFFVQRGVMRESMPLRHIRIFSVATLVCIGVLFILYMLYMDSGMPLLTYVPLTVISIFLLQISDKPKRFKVVVILDVVLAASFALVFFATIFTGYAAVSTNMIAVVGVVVELVKAVAFLYLFIKGRRVVKKLF